VSLTFYSCNGNCVIFLTVNAAGVRPQRMKKPASARRKNIIKCCGTLKCTEGKRQRNASNTSNVMRTPHHKFKTTSKEVVI
jgi:hypothetical protein